MFLFMTSTTETKPKNLNDKLDIIISKLAKQDNHALSDLYKLTSDSVYGFALSILKNPVEAEDVMHDVYVQLHKTAPNYTSSGKPMAWILTITKHHCMKRFSQYKRTVDLPNEQWENFIENHQVADLDDKFLLQFFMKQLSDEEQQIILLHTVSGFKHREIAQITGLKLSTVISKYNRSLKKLKHLMSEED